MITLSACVGACGRSVFRRRPRRIAAWLSGSFSIPPKRERSTFPLISTHRSKRQSSHFFAKRESRQTKLRLQVSSSVAARLRPSRLAASGSESSLRSYLVSSMDGKQSRVKIEMTERGRWEHHLDYLIENSWWVAIAFHLWRSGQFPNVFYFFALLIGSHLLDEFAKRQAKMAKGRLLDDVTPFDRAFRLIAARRNVYVWILACGFLLDAFPQSYSIICGWAAVSAAVHLVRSIWICNARGPRIVDTPT